MIIQIPNPKLEVVCKDYNFKDDKRLPSKLLSEAQKAYEYEKQYGNIVVGLAAPQIGITKRAFVAFGQIFINPKITWTSEAEIYSKEGCLSLDREVIVERKRYKTVNLIWFNKARQLHQQYFNDDAAVIIQHEMDHLEGIMCNE